MSTQNAPQLTFKKAAKDDPLCLLQELAESRYLIDLKVCLNIPEWPDEETQEIYGLIKKSMEHALSLLADSNIAAYKLYNAEIKELVLAFFDLHDKSVDD